MSEGEALTPGQQQTQQEISTLRSSLAFTDPFHPAHGQATAALEAAYKRRHPPSAEELAAREAEKPPATAETAPAPPMPELPVLLPEDGRWHVPTVAAALDTFRGYGVADSLVTSWLERGVENLTSGRRPNPEETDRALEELWGDRADAMIAAAGRVFAQLPPQAVDFLEKTGLGDDVELIRLCADLATRFPGGPRQVAHVLESSTAVPGSPEFQRVFERRRAVYQRVHGTGEV